MQDELNYQTGTHDTNAQTMIIHQLNQQNQLLAQQNRLLQELLDKTPDKNEIRAGFGDQQKQLVSISKTQQSEYVWSWVKFALMALAILLMFYGMYRIWSYFATLNTMLSQYAEMLSQYAERFSSSFGGLEETLEQIQEFFVKLKEFLRIG
ncbi:MAG: hypothetical protein IJH64_13670 [Oscillospiraceae bacterium]|nr:hypothetical protein [Oscillospiraceae bacterium]MBR0451042.1 hypothetical protein [Oscillospiraceae bacterium]